MSSQSSQRRFTEEFKEQAVRQVTDQGHPVSDVASRLGVSTNSLYAWLKRYAVSPELRVRQDEQGAQLRRLTAELKRVSEERDILKNDHRGVASTRWQETHRVPTLIAARP